MNKKNTVKDYMAEALINIMSEKDFTDITVTDLTNKANVGRASFYRNYKSTSDVLDYALNKMITQNKDVLFSIIFSDNTDADYIQPLIDKLGSSQSINALSGKNARIVYEKINKRYNEFVNSQNLSTTQKYIPFIKSKIFYETIKKWVVDGCVESSKSIANIITNMLNNIRICK